MKYWIVDAFADRAFVGNPAAVFLVQDFPRTELMQDIAMELNISNIAFVKRLAARNYHIRWFTPNSEAPLCGHATIASAHILVQTGAERSGESIVFQSLGGELKADVDNPWITLNFPRYVPRQVEFDDKLRDVVNLEPLYVGFSQNCFLMELRSAQQVAQLVPDLERLKQIDCRALIVTSRGEDEFHEYDFISRYFAPRVGINEDPVCASAHCRLIPYWAARLGKKHLSAYQASKRGGIISCEDAKDRVLISGTAITVAKGELC